MRCNDAFFSGVGTAAENCSWPTRTCHWRSGNSVESSIAAPYLPDTATHSFTEFVIIYSLIKILRRRAPAGLDKNDVHSASSNFKLAANFPWDRLAEKWFHRYLGTDLGGEKYLEYTVSSHQNNCKGVLVQLFLYLETETEVVVVLCRRGYVN